MNQEKLTNHRPVKGRVDFEGPVDASDFKVYVFPLLFFKRLSDVYDEEYAMALEESGGDKMRPCQSFTGLRFRGEPLERCARDDCGIEVRVGIAQH